MISYLRSGSKIYPVFENAYDECYFANELEFWGLPPSELFQEKSIINRFPKELVEYLYSEPLETKVETL